MFDHRIAKWIAAALLAVLALASAAAWAGDATVATGSTQDARAATDLAMLQDKWGVEIVGLRRSAVGHVLDFRYRVLDPEKARPLVEGRATPHVIDHARKLLLQIPAPEKVGQLRQRHMSARPGVVYFMLFGNPGRAVQAGDKVSVVIGDFRIDDIVVEG